VHELAVSNWPTVVLQTSVCSLLCEHFLVSSRNLRDKYQGRDAAVNDRFTEYGQFVGFFLRGLSSSSSSSSFLIM